jgi:hypothetical protein
MARETIPKKIKETVLDEYDHRCAICGSDRPHLHHIDEDAINNEITNLIPLCPNCHLIDQHNPTRKVEISKLKMFREYKDPAILKPQFHPLFTRQQFLDEIDIHDSDIGDLERRARELREFVEAFEMGSFYANRIQELIAPFDIVGIIPLGPNPDPRYVSQLEQERMEYKTKLKHNSQKVKSLLVELLRYQGWANA